MRVELPANESWGRFNQYHGTTVCIFQNCVSSKYLLVDLKKAFETFEWELCEITHIIDMLLRELEMRGNRGVRLQQK